MEQKRYRIFVLLLAALLVAIPGVMAFGALLPAQYEQTFLGELVEKQQLLEQTPGKRIILIGGSSVAFGVDSRQVETALPEYRVVNFGLYAALGTRVMLDLALPQLRQGDIVILSPEQDPQALSLFFGAEAMWQAVDGNFPLLRDTDPETWTALLAQFPYFSMGKLRNLLTGELPQPSGVYAKASFNSWGDVESPLCSQNILPGGVDPSTPIRFDTGVISREFIDCCNAFAAAAGEKGAQVWYRFCPMNAAAAQQPQQLDGYAAWLCRQLTFPLMGDPNTQLLPMQWFYDTNFHLNTSGRQLHTGYLVKDIKAMLGDPSPTELSIPAMPVLADQPPFQGDDADAACFSGEIREGVAVLTGLTEEGLAKQILTVPTCWEGFPVAALEPGVFAQSVHLEEIRLQENISYLEDGIFAGCAKLRRIRLNHENPAELRVGKALLEGTEAVILVPQTALGAYRSHYSWALYASKIQKDNGGW